MDSKIDDFLLCPESFRFNCASYEINCYKCGACSGSLTEELEYKPIERDEHLKIKNHPFLIKKKKNSKEITRQEKLTKKSSVNKEKSNQVKNALKNEKKVVKSLGGKLTIGSGRILGDGDGFIETTNGKFYIEVKTRYSENSSMFPTSSEYKKALEQGVKIFIVESAKGNTVTMSKESFMELFGL